MNIGIVKTAKKVTKKAKIKENAVALLCEINYNIRTAPLKGEILMKKLISVLLTMCIVLGLCACGGAASSSNEGGQTQAVLQAGYGRMDITPDHPVGMGGYSDSETRKSGMTLDYIYTTCVAFQEGETTLLVYTIDVCGLNDSGMEKIRNYVSPFVNVPKENIIIGATHTHSAPAMGNDDAWDNAFLKACGDAAKKAIDDLAPIQMQTATATLENMNFVRHYLMNDGTYYGSNFGSTASGFKAHALEYPDRQLILVKLERESKKDILMVNWQAHPAAAARQDDYTAVSADFVGHLRMTLENETGMQVAYYTGASGNTNPKSLIEVENTNNNNSYREYGKTLAKKVLEVLPNLTPVEGTGIKVTQFDFEAEIDHSWDHMKKEADEVFNLWKSEGKDAGDKLGATYGFTSSYQARAIRTRYNLPATQVRQLRAFRVGPIGFTSGSYEMFSDHAEYVKANSPFDLTFVISGNSGYIANELAYTYRSYETDTGMYASGTGEAMAAKYVELLNAVK